MGKRETENKIDTWIFLWRFSGLREKYPALRKEVSHKEKNIFLQLFEGETCGR